MSDVADKDGPSSAGEPPTYAAFSPAFSAAAFPAQRNTVVIHQKSPLLLATPPQVTRALAYSHPFILLLNNTFGLLSWTTDDPWESFLLVAVFWGLTSYGDIVLRWTGPLLLAIGLMLGMYCRRFSPLSTSFTKPSGTSHTRNSSSTDFAKVDNKSSSGADTKSTRHHKSLDSILSTLTTLTHRCNILVTPFIQLTDFLSTQRTATSSTTSPALAALFLRLLALTPVWFALTLPPLRIVTTKRVVLTLGTLILTWHSRPAKVSRVVLWRSRTIRRLCGWITGLTFPGSSSDSSQTLKPSHALARSTSHKALKSLYNKNGKSNSPGIGTGSCIHFTFSLFENQRRWLGIGWTASMLAYERSPWTDEELNPTAPKDDFRLPGVDGGVAVWRWAEGCEWRLEIDDTGETQSEHSGKSDGESVKSGKGRDREKSSDGPPSAWVYTDTKWRYPRREQDGWGKYTRRRKWVREAELVDAELSETPIELEGSSPPPLPPRPLGHTRSNSSLHVESSSSTAMGGKNDESKSGLCTPSGTPVGSPAKKGWFGRRQTYGQPSNISPGTQGESSFNSGMSPSSSREDKDSIKSVLERDDDSQDDGYIPLHLRGRQGTVAADWGVGDDVGLSLG